MATKGGVTTSSGHVAKDLEDDVMVQYKKDFSGTSDTDKFVKLNPGGWVFPKSYLKFEKQLYNFKFRPDDVVIMTYPKTGTTWTQEIVWTMRNNPDLDLPKEATDEALFVRSPFIDMDMFVPEVARDQVALSKDPVFLGCQKWCPDLDPNGGLMLQLANAVVEPRTLKTHMAFSLFQDSLLDTCKVVFVARNPKDVVLSYMHHCKLFVKHGFTGDLDCFIKYFVDDMLIWGSFAEIIKEAWKKRYHPNLHWIFYEDLKADIIKELKRLDTFLGTSLTDQQLNNVAQHTSFSTMQANDPAKLMQSEMIDRKVAEKDGAFIRKGEAGRWKGKLTPQQDALLDKYVQDNFQGTGIHFKYQ